MCPVDLTRTIPADTNKDATRKLAFSVENILDPNKFCSKKDKFNARHWIENYERGERERLEDDQSESQSGEFPFHHNCFQAVGKPRNRSISMWSMKINLDCLQLQLYWLKSGINSVNFGKWSTIWYDKLGNSVYALTCRWHKTNFLRSSWWFSISIRCPAQIDKMAETHFHILKKEWQLFSPVCLSLASSLPLQSPHITIMRAHSEYPNVLIGSARNNCNADRWGEGSTRRRRLTQIRVSNFAIIILIVRCVIRDTRYARAYPPHAHIASPT